jgi:hypothetical protein
VAREKDASIRALEADIFGLQNPVRVVDQTVWTLSYWFKSWRFDLEAGDVISVDLDVLSIESAALDTRGSVNMWLMQGVENFNKMVAGDSFRQFANYGGLNVEGITYQFTVPSAAAYFVVIDNMREDRDVRVSAVIDVAR